MCARFFPRNPWPNYDELKQAMEEWLKASHASYLTEIGEIDWTNAFAGKHCTNIIIVDYQQLTD